MTASPLLVPLFQRLPRHRRIPHGRLQTSFWIRSKKIIYFNESSIIQVIDFQSVQILPQNFFTSKLFSTFEYIISPVDFSIDFILVLILKFSMEVFIFDLSIFERVNPETI